MNLSPEEADVALEIAMGKLDVADVEARRAAALARLIKQQRLAYAAVPEDPDGVHLVAFRGHLLGQVRTTTSGPLGDWYAQPKDSEARTGPYQTARAAAASLMSEGSVTEEGGPSGS